MPRRTRRVLPLVLPLVLGLALTACGDDSGDEAGAGSGLDSLQIEGEPGSNPEVTFDGRVEVDETTSEVVSEGDGEEVAAGDSVLAHVWIGNGFSQEESFSTYTEEPKAPQLFTADEAVLSKLFLEGIEGHTVGSRVAVAATAEDAFGEAGNSQLGIGNKDTVVAVVDIISGVPDAIEGEPAQGPGWAPSVVEKDGEPSSFDFTGTPEPGGQLRSATLVEGDGETVRKGQALVVRYLGQVYESKKPFDENFSAEQPTSFPIGVGGVVPGWDKSLVGAKVGSRVLLSIPPDDGYGEAGNPQAGIKGTDTLFFVVDILAAA